MIDQRLLWITALCCAACSGNATVDGPWGTGGSTTSSSSSGSSSSSSSSGGSGCAGACSVHEFCDYADNRCGTGEPGSCSPRPQGCPDQLLPSCGCDGNVYPNPCEANTTGIDISNDEICTPPLDSFACGSTFCAYGTEYCMVQISDVGGWPDEYSCSPLPPGCNDPSATCACLASEPCGTMCEQDVDGSFTLTCPGG